MVRAQIIRYFDRVDTTNTEVVLINAGPSEVDPIAISETIENELDCNLEPDCFSILVPEPNAETTISNLSSDVVFQATLERLRDSTTVQIVSFRLTGNNAVKISVLNDQQPVQTDLSQVYRRALSDLFEVRGGFVEATKSYHFENPSGRHTDRFLRLSNLLQTSSDIYLLAQACMSFIPVSTSNIWIDTPSLFSIAAAINEYRVLFGYPTVSVECFRSYQDYVNIPEHGFGTTDYVLISASSSEGLARRIQSEIGFDKARIGHVLYLGEASPTFGVACNLRHDERVNPTGVKSIPRTVEPSACLLCREGSSVVYLKGDQFDIQGPQPTPVLMTKSSAPSGLSAVMGRFVKYNCLGLSIPNGSPRNREYFIDVEKMCSTSIFKDRLNYILSATLPASTSHIVVVDTSTTELANAVKQHLVKLGVKPTILKPDDLDEASGATAVVVVVGAIESGRCLTDISRDLRNIIPGKPITYLVGVDKSSGIGQRDRLESTLVQTSDPVNHRYQSVELLRLPASQSENAWTAERDLLSDPEFAEVADRICAGWRVDRLETINAASELRESLFMKRLTGEKMTLQKGFVFWPSKGVRDENSEADVFFTVSSVLQNLRVAAKDPNEMHALRDAWYHQSLLDPTNFVRFNDDLLQACLLRAARPSELNYREDSSSARTAHRIISRVLKSAHLERGGAAPEFLLSLVLHRLGLDEEYREDLFRIAIDKGGILQVFGEYGLSMTRNH